MENSKIVTLGNGIQIELMRPDLGLNHRVLNNDWMGIFTMHFGFGCFYVRPEIHTINMDNISRVLSSLQEYSSALNEADKHAQDWQAEYENWKLNQKYHGI